MLSWYQSITYAHHTPPIFQQQQTEPEFYTDDIIKGIILVVKCGLIVGVAGCWLLGVTRHQQP
ncbi:detoxifying efflux carrier 35 [Prunus dulcis]|uniref:Detoxifying efflux carrier 35 n=1 Tax=Prunus dulcis TaxID=3755 RepID=A0A5H2XYP6_PRUDU|nr:detoxifying efflux carrier 35 [Prunus dulcis]